MFVRKHVPIWMCLLRLFSFISFCFFFSVSFVLFTIWLPHSSNNKPKTSNTIQNRLIEFICSRRQISIMKMAVFNKCINVIAWLSLSHFSHWPICPEARNKSTERNIRKKNWTDLDFSIEYFNDNNYNSWLICLSIESFWWVQVKFFHRFNQSTIYLNAIWFFPDERKFFHWYQLTLWITCGHLTFHTISWNSIDLPKHFFFFLIFALVGKTEQTQIGNMFRLMIEIALAKSTFIANSSAKFVEALF